MYSCHLPSPLMMNPPSSSEIDSELSFCSSQSSTLILCDFSFHIDVHSSHYLLTSSPSPPCLICKSRSTPSYTKIDIPLFLFSLCTAPSLTSPPHHLQHHTLTCIPLLNLPGISSPSASLASLLFSACFSLPPSAQSLKFC